ncbi:hypothetical protein [Yimella lutea]|uniref:hypothetical protein n=1 Tax=Yimella lutea TaxID=587872 RepID=UPI001FE336DA|nr:hypothetical protein [Yimella lutea]
MSWIDAFSRLVDVRAASINGLDKLVRNGEFKQLLEYERAFVLVMRLSAPDVNLAA